MKKRIYGLLGLTLIGIACLSGCDRPTPNGAGYPPRTQGTPPAAQPTPSLPAVSGPPTTPPYLIRWAEYKKQTGYDLTTLAERQRLERIYRDQVLPSIAESSGESLEDLRRGFEITLRYDEPTVPALARPPTSLTFAGNRCTDDCSGHQAGFDWAVEHDIVDPDDCSGKSQSFIEGCRTGAEANQEAAEPVDDGSNQGTRY